MSIFSALALEFIRKLLRHFHRAKSEMYELSGLLMHTEPEELGIGGRQIPPPALNRYWRSGEYIADYGTNRQELIEHRGFLDVPSDAQLSSGKAIGWRIGRSENNDGHAFEPAAAAYMLQDFHAVVLRQIEVEQNQVGKGIARGIVLRPQEG
jgi:hypothetical protein